jgi:hypothetical protein
VYQPPLQALGVQLGRGAVWLLTKHPRETAHCLAMVATGFAVIHFVGKAIHESR